MASSHLQHEVAELSARVDSLEHQQVLLVAQSTEASTPTLETQPTVKSRWAECMALEYTLLQSM